jgi:hypothetical protein
MKNFGLPKDTIDFLKTGKQFNYDPSRCEAGSVKLKNYSELEMGKVWVNSYQSPIANEDPHAGEDGYYIIPSVDLISECEAYGAEGILMWLPDYKIFGQWDCDHCDVVVFPETKWGDIVSNPALYLGAQWEVDLNGGQYLKPWDKCKFKRGSPF